MIKLVITIAITGLIVWAIVNFIPMPSQFKTLIIVLAAICVGVYILRSFGIWSGTDIPIPNLRGDK